jgi:hypothetical protein
LERTLFEAIESQEEGRLANHGQLGLGNAIPGSQGITDQLTGEQTFQQWIKFWSPQFQQHAGPKGGQWRLGVATLGTTQIALGSGSLAGEEQGFAAQPKAEATLLDMLK